jgi:hypothetical protein
MNLRVKDWLGEVQLSINIGVYYRKRLMVVICYRPSRLNNFYLLPSERNALLFHFVYRKVKNLAKKRLFPYDATGIHPAIQVFYGVGQVLTISCIWKRRISAKHE